MARGALERAAYLDANATTPLCPEAAAVWSAESVRCANPSSPHLMGRAARARYDRALQEIRALCGAAHFELALCGGGTEANFVGLLSALHGTPCTALVVSAAEHSSVVGFADHPHLGTTRVCGIDRDGHVDLEALRACVAEERCVVAVMHANNETGVLSDLSAVADIVRGSRGWLHVDACQTFGRVELQPALDVADSLSFSAHKFHGPHGVGGLLVRESARLSAVLPGGHQGGLRSGTLDLPGARATAAALRRAIRDQEHFASLATRRDRFEACLESLVPHAVVFGAARSRLPNTSCVAIPGLESEDMIDHLASHGFIVGRGSACSSATLGGSHVLRAMGVPLALRQGQLRLSWSRDTPESIEDRIAELLADFVAMV